MPDVLTHYIFGLDTVQNVKASPVYTCIKEYRDLFLIGLQGPDPIYYHHLLRKDNKAFIGTKMHTEKTGDFLISALCQIKKYGVDTPQFKSGLSYLCGFICHYILDSMAHPYIFYMSGQYIPDNPDTKKYIGLHRKVELAIDSILCEERLSKKSSQFKIHKHLLKDVKLPENILNMFDETLFLNYGINNGGQIFKEAYSDLRTYYQLTYDHFGTKKAFAGMISPLVKKSIAPYIGTFSYHNCINPDFDYMNRSKHVWLHPVTGNVFTFSFYDILRNATKKSTALVLQAHEFATSNLSAEGFRAALPNISYLTGLSTDDQRPMKYFSKNTSYL